jgi:signal transduction histidine kinase/CheY-like chemotaxis protein
MPVAWIGGVLATGILLSIGMFLAVRGWERRELEERAAVITHEQIEKLHISVLRSMEVLYSIAALHQAEGRIVREQFRQFVQVALARQPELQALSWNPVVPAGCRSEIETAAVSEGMAGFQLREHGPDGTITIAQERAEYVPVYVIEPLERNAEALGFDLNSDPGRRRSMEQARDSGLPVATAPVRLAQGAVGEVGFLVLLPIYREGRRPASVEERRAAIDGFAVAVFKVANLVGASFRELRDKGIVARLFDHSPEGEKIHGPVPDVPGGRLASIEVAGRRWFVEFSPTDGFAAAYRHWQSWLVLTAGMAFSLLSAAYLYGGWRRTRQVADVNAALEEEVRVRQLAESAAATANQAKSDFLASMSHEIRTPLNAILGYAQLMRRDPQMSGDQRDAIHGISASGQHLLGLINEILDLSKIEAGRMELNPVHFDLAALGRGLAATFKPLCAEKGIGFRLQIEAGTHVRGDEGKLRQVLINLLGNAVKFTSAGEVFLGCKRVASGRCFFEVIDTGVGIPPEEQPHIFKPFHQGSGAQHQGGTGLGLAIAQRQVELLGGRLEVQSERGFGSRFHFSIPLEAADAVRTPQQERFTRLVRGTAVRALVVDDRRENRDVLSGMLSSLGCEVWSCANGAEAMGLVSERKPRIVFLDLLLAGDSGVDIAERLRAESRPGNLKIVMHSAAALSSHREAALGAGCVDFIAKPFLVEQICQCLHRHLGVEFEDLEAPDALETPLSEPVRVVLPEPLCARLMVAAELHSTTALKAALQELRTFGPEAVLLAEHLRHLMRSYDMDGIQRLLSRVAVPASAPFAATLSHGITASKSAA